MNKLFLVALFFGAAVATIAPGTDADEALYCPTDVAGCVDGHDSCGAWATNGECPVNSPYMLPTCALSCCSICVVEEVVVDPAVCPEDAANCVAQTNSMCQTWADVDSEGLTQCEENAIWMTPNCMQSCCEVCHHDANKCPTVKPTIGCMNVPQTDADVVNAACAGDEWKLTCTECDVPTSDECVAKTTAADADIIDIIQCDVHKACVAHEAVVAVTDASCSSWAKLGECTANPVWMNANCAKNCCSVCHDHEATPTAAPVRVYNPFPQQRISYNNMVPVFNNGYSGFNNVNRVNVAPAFGGYANNNMVAPAFGGYGNGLPYGR